MIEVRPIPTAMLGKVSLNQFKATRPTGLLGQCVMGVQSSMNLTFGDENVYD
jgi:hypothetical protein